ncbi:hypothetical protein AAFC00_004573 [Neodothiora populina]|uniref:gamma-glutamylcyclotransferase n=1 Tax=Neodothiora populina TaxID=2781224 RepID=A0ABR3P2S9_9PEZI
MSLLSAAAAASSVTTTPPTLYFGYGSNLWQHQMRQRCATSTYQGIARLSNYQWQINQRGYANVVEMDGRTLHGQTSSDSGPAQEQQQHDHKKHYSNVTYGLLYSLLPADEAALDENEGVPFAYTKETLTVDIWASDDPSRRLDVGSEPPTMMGKVLVYINREMTRDSVPKAEYVERMNSGIRDALAVGVPEEYVEEVMRRFIPEKVDGEGWTEVAMQQAMRFEEGR